MLFKKNNIYYGAFSSCKGDRRDYSFDFSWSLVHLLDIHVYIWKIIIRAAERLVSIKEKAFLFFSMWVHGAETAADACTYSRS